jgi:hypothetical protein
MSTNFSRNTEETLCHRASAKLERKPKLFSKLEPKPKLFPVKTKPELFLRARALLNWP